MKQEITTDQWDELSNVAKSLWRQWAFNCKFVQEDKDGAIMPMPTIGQMIYFLGEHVHITKFEKGVYLKKWRVYFLDSPLASISTYTEKKNLCDALWEAVKKSTRK